MNLFARRRRGKALAADARPLPARLARGDGASACHTTGQINQAIASQKLDDAASTSPSPMPRANSPIPSAAEPITRPAALPTRASATIFATKAALLRARRTARDLLHPPPKLQKAGPEAFGPAAATSRTSLRDEARPAERALESGKIQNLRAACQALDGLVLPAGAVFSLWRHLGPPATRRGYTTGRMLKQGCMVPSTGGGLCQLSNALYDLALRTGCAIIERHGHSRVIPGSAAAAGRDATIAWNYVDLRFSPARDLRLTARVGPDRLELALAPRVAAPAAARAAAPLQPAPLITARGCESCGETACFRHTAPAATAGLAVLLDENWPEFLALVAAEASVADAILAPLNGVAWRLPRYACPGVALTATAPLATLRRAAALRRAATPPARRQAEICATARLAAALAAKIPAAAEHLIVAQSYLPHLHERFHLGGRSYDVMMTRLPISALHAALDQAAATHPAHASLTDFRAPAALALAEAEALAGATRIITPHTAIAALFPGRAVVVPWRMPAAAPRPAAPASRRILFPGPTAARKGALELRAAAKQFDLEVAPLGAELEGGAFWNGVRLSTNRAFAGAAAMVLPAFVEDQPRRLLAALASGLPVIATPACGLPPQPNLTLVPPGDTGALTEAIARFIT